MDLEHPIKMYILIPQASKNIHYYRRYGQITPWKLCAQLRTCAQRAHKCAQRLLDCAQRCNVCAQSAHKCAQRSRTCAQRQKAMRTKVQWLRTKTVALRTKESEVRTKESEVRTKLKTPLHLRYSTRQATFSLNVSKKLQTH